MAANHSKPEYGLVSLLLLSLLLAGASGAESNVASDCQHHCDHQAQDITLVSQRTNNLNITNDLLRHQRGRDESAHDNIMAAEMSNMSRVISSEVQNGTIEEETMPQWKKDLDFATTIILTCNTINLMLGMGAATYWREVVGHAWPPTGIVIGMIGQFLLLPACGSLLSYLFLLTKYEAMGVLMVSCSPGGSFSNFFTFWCDGDLALSIVMTTFSSVLAFGGMPFNIWLYSRIWEDDDESTPLVIPYSIITIALVFITIPVAIGMIIRHFNQRVARIITQVASILGWLGCLLVMIIWMILYWRVFLDATPLLYLSAFLLPVLGFSIAYIFARILCRSHKVCRTIGIETGSQNMVVALSIILLSFKEPTVRASMLLFPTLYGMTLLIEIFIGITLFHAWRRYCSKNGEDYYPDPHTATIEKGVDAEMTALRHTTTSN